jgi:hypothetical protein
MIGSGWLLLFPVVLGFPIACVGVILRLCEWIWEKPSGSMGSTTLLAAYGYVCMLTFVAALLVLRFK